MIAKELPEGVTVKVTPRGKNPVNFGADNLYSQDSFTIGQTQYYRIDVTVPTGDPEKTEDNKTVKLRMDRLVPAEMVNNSIEVTVNKGMRTWFKFTVPEDGRYTFSDNSTTVDVRCYVSKYNMVSNPSSVSLPAEYVLYEGDVIYLGAYYTDALEGEVPASATFTVSVKKAVATAITGNGFSAVMEPNSDNWYSFTASNIDQYKLTFKEVVGEASTDVSVRVYDSIIVDSYYTTSAYDAFMTKGETIYFRYKNNSNEQRNFQVTIESPSKSDLNLNGSVTVTYADAESGYKWLQANVAESGYYTVKRIDGNNTVYSAYILHGSNAEENYISTSESVLYLEAGRVLVRIDGYVGDSVTIEMHKVATFNPEGEYEVTLDKNGYTYVACKINRSGKYYINKTNGGYAPDYVSYKNIGDYYSSIGTGTYDAGMRFQGDNILFRISGDAGDSVILNVYRNTTYTVSSKGAISSGNKVNVSLDSYEAVYYTFTAPEAGYYDFWSEGSADTYGEWYDVEGMMISSDDDGGASFNYEEDIWLEKGEQIKYLVRGSGWGEVENTTVCVDAE